jgi:hypothetical protein
MMAFLFAAAALEDLFFPRPEVQDTVTPPRARTGLDHEAEDVIAAYSRRS